MKPRLGDLVEVTWLDAWADHETSRAHDWSDETRALTRGELCRLTDDVVSVAAESFPKTGEFRCVTHIPRRMIEKIRVIERGGSAPA